MTTDLESQIRTYADFLDEVDPPGAPPTYIRAPEPTGRRHRGRWLLAAAAAVVVIGGVGVALSVTRDDAESPAVASTPTSTTAPRQLIEEIIDGRPGLGGPVGDPVEFTISTPDGDIQGTMQRSAGDFGDGSGFCVGLSGGGGGCYGSSNGTYVERPHLQGYGGGGRIGDPITMFANWLLPDGVDELLITWDDGSSVLLPVVRPFDDLPGVTATAVPDGVLGGTATGGGVDVPFTFHPRPTIVEGPNGPYMVPTMPGEQDG